MLGRITGISLLLKKIHRLYSQDLLLILGERGFTDLRPSFLEILIFLCEKEGVAIKSIGENCGLKKQTMTSHLNELEKRGYIKRDVSLTDKREQLIYLTDYGRKFKMGLLECTSLLEQVYTTKVGEVEVERVLKGLENFYAKQIGDLFYQGVETTEVDMIDNDRSQITSGKEDSSLINSIS